MTSLRRFDLHHLGVGRVQEEFLLLCICLNMFMEMIILGSSSQESICRFSDVFPVYDSNRLWTPKT